MDPFTAAFVVGVGLQAYSAWSGGQAQAKAAKQQARLKEAQANEMLSRMAVQETRLKSQGDAFAAQQMTSFAKGGVAVGSGATLVAMEDTHYKIATEISDMKRDTIFRANQIRLGASFDLEQGQQASRAGAILAGATLLEGAGSYKKLNT